MKKYLSRSVILSALLFAGFICTQPALAQVKFPYNVYGNILNADGSVPAPADIRFTAYISSRPAEVLTEASQGSSVTDEGGSTQYLLDLASLPTQYQNGDQVVISVVNSLLSQAKTNIVTVDTAVPFKQSDVQLVPRPVIVPPSITSHPDDVVTRVSGRATFNVGVSGTAPFTFQWKKGSTTLPGQTSQTLVLTNVQTTDAGAYSVSITNAAGFTNSNPATLTVLVPPTIVTPPRSQVVTQGLTSVSFDVVAAGTPPFSYQWRFNGNPLDEGAKYAGVTTTNLTAFNLQASDEGNYSVIVTNLADSVPSANALLTVRVPPSITSLQPPAGSLVATQGATLTFSVNAAGSSPLGYQWRKNGVNLNNTAPISGATSATLQITGVRTNETASYTVVVTNLAGAVTSAPPITLTVLVPPNNLVVQPASQSLPVSSNVTFSVVASGTPPLSYQWLFNGNPLSDGGKYGGVTTSNLTVFSLQTADDGSYSVIVTNLAGSATSANALLSVRVPPTITSLLPPPGSMVVTQGANLTFSVDADGGSPLRYQWRKNGVNLNNTAPISGATNATLQITGVRTNEEGSFTVVVTNSSGAVTSAPPITLTVLVPPNNLVIQPGNQTVGESNNATFSVTAKGTAPFSYQWLKNGTPVPDAPPYTGASSNVLTITEAKPQNQGSYSVVVANLAGFATSAPPAILTVTNKTPPSLAITSHSDLQLLNVSVITLAGTASDAGRGDSGITSVTVNSVRATNDTALAAGTANWNRLFSLVPGTNRISVVAKDGSAQSVTNIILIISDTNRPVVTATNLLANQRISNAVFTVRGRATDNLAVSNVWYRFNSNNWLLANGVVPGRTSLWSAPLELEQRTNKFEVCADDMAGNRGATSSVAFVYVKTGVLRVATVGQGTLTPNLSNAVLEIGLGSSMTVAGVNGHQFRRWEMSTNWVDPVVVTNAKLSFIMQSNLTLTAVFADTNRPVATVTNLSVNQRISNAVFTVRGRATDNVAVSNVWYRLNGAPDWLLANGVVPSRTSLWSAPLELEQRTNKFEVCADDMAGNRGATSSVAFVYVKTGVLRVATVGQGTFTPNLSNAVLEIGLGSSMTAAGVNGHQFRHWEMSTNWVDPVVVTNVKLPFIMQSNLTLTVVFADTNRPVATVTNLLANQRISNAVFTVRGRVTDNVAVSNVWYRLNSAPNWLPANGVVPGRTSLWSAPLEVEQRTNKFEVCADDMAGNRGATSSVTFVYVKTGVLRVATVGQGTLSPNLSNAVLEIGLGSSMTAAGVNGHQFRRWEMSTNWLDPVVVTNAKLTFIMQSNLTLTAVFADTNRPVATVTNLAANQRISNAVFTVRGRATDNVAVSNVWYRLNSAPDWLPANGVVPGRTSLWSAPLELEQRTNKLEVCADDLTGNRGATSSVAFVYVKTGVLRVATVGQGTLTPNLSNAVLEIGLGSSMTAAGVNGHQFRRWEMSTNWVDPVVVTNAKLTFIMQSNLTLTAVFADTNRPVATVTNLAANQRISNAVFTVRGRATDNMAVSNVWYRLNSNDWVLANGVMPGRTSLWSAPLELEQRTNKFEVCAEDLTSNRGATSSVSFVYVATSQLTLTTNGLGTITRSFTGNILELGKSFTVTATPGTGYLFSNWSGTITATTNPLNFLMQSNMMLAANFVPNPFTPVKGTYNGLFYPTHDQSVNNAGSFQLTLTDSGTFSGRLLLAGTTLNFSGAFRIDGTAQVTVARSGAPPLPMTLTLAPAERAITGLVDGGAWQAPLSSDLAATTAGALAGTYTLLVDGDDDAALSPPGLGAATVIVSSNGSVKVTGTLADNAPLTCQTSVAADGVWPLYSSLYTNRGVLLGWMECSTNRPALWLKGAGPADKYYSNGFVATRTVMVARYTQPTAGQSALNWTNGFVILSGGNLPAPLTNEVLLATNQIRVIGGSISNLSLSLTLSNGLLSGSFLHPVTRTNTVIKGAVVQDPLNLSPLPSGGWFLGTNQGGYFILRP